MGTHDDGDGDQQNVLRLWPEWGPRDLIPDFIPISDPLRLRLRNWNHTWQTVLDPTREIRWPNAEIGRRWIAEGESLVRDLQLELGPQVRVVAGFRAYDPDGEQATGP
ncbi:hypothetical protein ACEXQB_001645 [Herbiconiux sp. P18]|uniref:hypothetical protein n=1 Tax=Herbiconiux liangxiaofengii TaxID=3342795 RepID=UPI0035BB2C1B